MSFFEAYSAVLVTFLRNAGAAAIACLDNPGTEIAELRFSEAGEKSITSVTRKVERQHGFGLRKRSESRPACRFWNFVDARWIFKGDPGAGKIEGIFWAEGREVLGKSQ